MTVRDDYEHCRDRVLEILTYNNVDEDSTDSILGMLENAFFKLNESYASGRALERILDDNGIYTKDYFRQYMSYYGEELQKYPWASESNDEEDE